MDFKTHLERSWHMTLQFIVPLIFMTLVMGMVSFLTLGILGPVTMAGYMQAILLMIRDGREPKIQDVFSQMNLFLPLTGFGIGAMIAISVGIHLLFLPGFLITLALIFGCLYMLPLMTDKKLGLVDAVKHSLTIGLQGNVPEHVITAILYAGISWIGMITIIGFLFTQPLATIFLLLVYEEKIVGAPPPLKQK